MCHGRRCNPELGTAEHPHRLADDLLVGMQARQMSIGSAPEMATEKRIDSVDLSP
jgi:hypothetical protein